MAGEIVCVGEVLWDSLPDGLFLGGAVFNAACHLRALGEPAVFASRVGDDELGREVLRRMERRGLDPGWVQVDRDLETGFVAVKLDSPGSPRFEILEPSAWDAIEPDGALIEIARTASALVHGSLALRNGVSRETLRLLFETGVPRVFDVNLRPPFVNPAVVEECLRGASIVKLNEEEWEAVRDWLKISGGDQAAAGDLAARFGIETICVTRGARGAALWTRGIWAEDPGFRVDVVDTVGAGDAFLAALIAGFRMDRTPARILEEACLLGAFVATRPGATPAIDRTEIEKIRSTR